MKVAILDDYQNVALKMADWSFVASRAEITVFNDHVADPEAVIERLLPFDVICVMRERTPLQREIIERLPRLKLIASTAQRNASIDMAAAEERGIRVTGTGYRSTPTVEMTWAFILASARHIVRESNSVRQGGWQTSIGRELGGRTLGVLGLGNVGAQVARIGLAFGMEVIAWSQNMTAETGSRLRGRIQAVLDAAQAHGHIADDKANPARWKGHLDKLLPRPAKLSRGHQKALPYADVPGFVQRLRASDNMEALALEFLILTATRTNETLGAQWCEVDLENATWTIPPWRMKTGEAFSVPLPDRAIAILTEARSRARQEPGPDSFVFFGAVPKKPLSNMALAMILRRMDVDATAHGFRSSFRTWCSDVAHILFEVAEACLSHKIGSAVSRAYARSDMLERRRPVMDGWADFLDGECGSATVVPFADKRR